MELSTRRNFDEVLGVCSRSVEVDFQDYRGSRERVGEALELDTRSQVHGDCGNVTVIIVAVGTLIVHVVVRVLVLVVLVVVVIVVVT